MNLELCKQILSEFGFIYFDHHIGRSGKIQTVGLVATNGNIEVTVWVGAHHLANEPYLRNEIGTIINEQLLELL
jgi:hypothetical protein